MTNAFSVDLSVLDTAPAHWDRRPLWALIRRRDVTNKPDMRLLSVYRDHGVVPKDSRDDNFNKPSEDLSNYKYVRPGDLVLNKMKTWQGSLAVSEYEGIVSPAYYVCALSADIYPRFAHHLLRSQPYIHLYQAVSQGIRPNQWDLPYEEFQRIPMLIPPVPEQRRIADFLDIEISRIYRLISLKKAILQKLDERDQAARDSFIDRLIGQSGEIPFRRFVSKVEQGTSPQCENYPRRSGRWGILKLSAVKSGRFYPEENKQLPTDVTPVKEYEVHDGDLLISRANTPELVGDVAVADGANPGLLLPDLIYRVKLDRRIDSNFAAQIILSTRVRSLIQATARGSSQSMVKLRGEDIRDWPMPRANSRQQEELVSAVKEQTNSSDRLRSVINRQITLLAERRQALITAAVTGRITV